jgi:hypothetical protein
MVVVSRVALVFGWIGAILLLCCAVVAPVSGMTSIGVPPPVPSSAVVRWLQASYGLDIILGVLAALVVDRTDRARLRRTRELSAANACGHCGYIDRTQHDRCPECGASPVPHVAAPVVVAPSLFSSFFMRTEAASESLGASLQTSAALRSLPWIEVMIGTAFVTLMIAAMMRHEWPDFHRLVNDYVAPAFLTAVVARVTACHALSFRRA